MNTPTDNAPGGSNANPGGNGGEGSGGTSGGADGGGNPPNDPKPDKVAFDTYSKVLDEAKAAKAKAKALQDELDKRDREAAEKAGDWKKLLELEREERARAERERDEAKGKVTEITTQQTQVRKLAAIVRASGGEVDPKWHGLIADRYLTEVVVNPETGEIDQASVTAAVTKLRGEFPEVIRSKVPGVPNGDPAAMGGGAKTIKRSEWRKLHSSKMKLWRPEQIIDD